MAQRITIPWSDGSGDNIYLDFSGKVGEPICTVTSDINKLGLERTEVIEFKTHDGPVEDASQVPIKLYIVQGVNHLIVATFDTVESQDYDDSNIISDSTLSVNDGRKAGYKTLK